MFLFRETLFCEGMTRLDYDEEIQKTDFTQNKIKDRKTKKIEKKSKFRGGVPMLHISRIYVPQNPKIQDLEFQR